MDDPLREQGQGNTMRENWSGSFKYGGCIFLQFGCDLIFKKGEVIASATSWLHQPMRWPTCFLRNKQGYKQSTTRQQGHCGS